MKEGWKDLEIKTRIAYISAILAFTIGWGLTIASFCVPPLGVIAESTLWVLGQALVYSASVFGVALYTTNAVRGMKRDVREFMAEEQRRKEIEEEDEV